MSNETVENGIRCEANHHCLVFLRVFFFFSLPSFTPMDPKQPAAPNMRPPHQQLEVLRKRREQLIEDLKATEASIYDQETSYLGEFHFLFFFLSDVFYILFFMYIGCTYNFLSRGLFQVFVLLSSPAHTLPSYRILTHDCDKSLSDDTYQYGNIIKGWEGYLNAKANFKSSIKRKIPVKDRVFSNSSLTAPNYDTQGGNTQNATGESESEDSD